MKLLITLFLSLVCQAGFSQSTSPEPAYKRFPTLPPLQILLGDSTTDGSRAGSVDNILVWMGGPDRLAGRGGIDSLDGGGGRDSLSAGRGGKPFFYEVLTGGAGRDRLFGGLGVDAVLGGTSNDVLHGGAASDRLSGDEGDDYLDGDAGRDFLDGGPGTDECLSGRRRQCE